MVKQLADSQHLIEMRHALYSGVISETLELVYFIYLIHSGNRTEWSPIWSVIIQVINKIRQLRSRRLNYQSRV